MCGRFAFFSPQEAIQLAFGSVRNFVPETRFNIAPSQPIAAFAADGEGVLTAWQLRWGLIPSWAKDPAMGNRLINARAETLAEKPSFRQAYRRRRCLIPASGFYEWWKQPQGKQPVYISAAEAQPLTFAGLWDEWKAPDGQKIASCTIVTTAANQFMQPYHHRMPVCLDEDARSLWMNATAQRVELDELVHQSIDVDLQAWPVSRRVNSPANDSSDLIEPIVATS